MDILNDKEKAAILYHVFTGCKDRAILFEIAEGENRLNKLKDSSKTQTFYNWYNSQKIQDGIKEITYQVEKIKKEYADKVIQDRETETREGQQKRLNKENVNFLNPEEFLKFANDQANEIQDEKERREYLKMIANLMNYKESDQEQTDIQRFYTPVLCESCEIYNRCKNCKMPECPKML